MHSSFVILIPQYHHDHSLPEIIKESESQVGRDNKDHLVQAFLEKSWSRQGSLAHCPAES